MRLVAIFLVSVIVVGAGGSDAEEIVTPSKHANSPDSSAQNNQLQTVATDANQQRGEDQQSVEPALPDRLQLREFLVLPRVDKPGRRVLHQDPIDAAIADGSWQPPAEGDSVTSAMGRRVKWKLAITDAQGRLSGPAAAGGYAFATVHSPEERIMLLNANRHASVRVNGSWIAGDPFADGGAPQPILLNKGTNTFLFHLAQPGFRATLVAADKEVQLTTVDATLPDVIEGNDRSYWASIPLVNATNARLTGGEIRVTLSDKTQVARVPAIEPLTVFKVPVRLPTPADGLSPAKVQAALYLPRRDTGSMSPDPTAEIVFELVRKKPDQRHTRTYISRIDGSVQAYEVIPAKAGTGANTPGILLALHDLGISNEKFAEYFEPKTWAHTIVPQNRRSVGFVWEDWGAADAMEALADAAKHFEHDERRVSVCGHGFGAYGALRLALRYPDRFAGVGMSAGKASYFSDPGPASSNPAPIEDLLRRGAESRATAGILRNLSTLGVYLLHGAEDQRLPAAESRYLRSRLGEFHTDFVYHERPGAGHWWGPEGVDWPAMMEFLKHQSIPLPGDIARVDFTTAHPSDASSCHWASIEGQQQPFLVSRVVIDQDQRAQTFVGRTENVSRLSLSLGHLKRSGSVTVTLDNSPPLQARYRGRSPRLWFAKNKEGVWKVTRPLASEKSPQSGGQLKSAWDNRVVLVYGTGGNEEENRWAEAKAQYDAQSFLRRGNASLEVMPDSAFDATTEPNRNVVLYGNAETNAAWPALLSTSPVQIRQGRVDVSVQGSGRPEIGDDLAVLMVRRRAGSRTASVAVIGGTGIEGMRATNRMRYFVPGVPYPDLLIMEAGVLTNGVSDVRAAGYFGADWSVEAGDVQWRDIAL